MCLELSGVPTSRTIGVRHVDVAGQHKPAADTAAQMRSVEALRRGSDQDSDSLDSK